MRKTPDGKREVIEMMVPIEGSRSRTVRITGLGLPPKVGVGAIDLPDAQWLEILNRDLKGHLAYDTVETVRGGMMPLVDKHLQGSDQIYAARSGATFGEGQLVGSEIKDGEVKIIDGEGPGQTMAWIITGSRGKFLLVAPCAFDSFDLAERIAPNMHGEFVIEMVTAGSMTACEEIVAPGWRVLLDSPFRGEVPSRSMAN